jgi:hypothetical protein
MGHVTLPNRVAASGQLASLSVIIETANDIER